MIRAAHCIITVYYGRILTAHYRCDANRTRTVRSKLNFSIRYGAHIKTVVTVVRVPYNILIPTIQGTSQFKIGSDQLGMNPHVCSGA